MFLLYTSCVLITWVAPIALFNKLRLVMKRKKISDVSWRNFIVVKLWRGAFSYFGVKLLVICGGASFSQN